VAAAETRPINEWIAIARAAPADRALPDGTPVEAAASLLDAVAVEHGLRHMADSARRAHELDRVDSFYGVTAVYLEGSALLLLGRPEEAKPCLEAAVRGGYLVPGSASAALSQLALVAASSGAWEEAGDLMDRAAKLVDEHHRGDLDGARVPALHARRLLSLLNHLGVWMAIEARMVLARVELLAGDVEAARVLAHEARDLLYRLSDAGILPERIDELFGAIESGAQAVSALSAAPLTTAELRVLAFLPTHLSFQAMAEKLFVSRNTVKTQAISIYRKLGVSSRGDAVARARELGLLEA
jgi:LuxR family maltose regulon positive regulatory protein